MKSKRNKEAETNDINGNIEKKKKGYSFVEEEGNIISNEL